MAQFIDSKVSSPTKAGSLHQLLGLKAGLRGMAVAIRLILSLMTSNISRMLPLMRICVVLFMKHSHQLSNGQRAEDTAISVDFEVIDRHSKIQEVGSRARLASTRKFD